MSCCGTGPSISAAEIARQAAQHADEGVDPAFLRVAKDGLTELTLIVPDMHCAGCISKVERSLSAVAGVVRARANLTAHKVLVGYEPETAEPDLLLATVRAAGYAARPVDPAVFTDTAEDETGKELIRSLAVAGFAAGNVMLLSVSVWSGADEATRNLFHWISAMIALPAIAYAGRPFFRSAWRAVSAASLNMDVPISLAVILAAAMSLYETMSGAPHAWFDASISLLFFLLIGRVLDFRMRGVARAAATRLLSLSADSARLLGEDGTSRLVRTGTVRPGDVVEVAAGERFPLDGIVLSGSSDVDKSPLTGEPLPERAAEGSSVYAGTLNLTGPMRVKVEKAAADSLLADIIRLMEQAEAGRGRFVGLADRAAALYAPAVHLLAAGTFLFWLFFGLGWHDSVMIAVAVLIITCPCALGLAVPATQIVASGRLLRRGVIVKDGGALERLSQIDTVVFDKTGTLTSGEPVMAGEPEADAADWRFAAALAAKSRHPLARALARAAVSRGIVRAELDDAREEPGSGMEGHAGEARIRLGRREWVAEGAGTGEGGAYSEIWLAHQGRAPVAFRFVDRLRPDAAALVHRLKEMGVGVMLLSGDRKDAVAAAARQLGIEDWQGAMSPAGKVAELQRLKEAGRTPLMVGDGINDAPALATAAVSMSPASGSDITQVAADFVLSSGELLPVADALQTARRAKRIILQNFAIALAYNSIAVPVAVAGLATPLIAAIAMSSSSILVTANALRLSLGGAPKPAAERAAPGLQEAAA
ncbi:heavy metal translocating P-type ATPase [Afifella sp. IM 167]|uniref:heavy metal translocating P-type ATPase n=1 Tax=Afifella sp. IM 167 TaxID=2033586 RepID=UPI001CCCAC30|nr:heavy metal translocating P-type ATPase [Afifella sp. IM 167]MBZ8132074.1 heavy metal translocating P-type ATPase [Afifella sp. IM 167]